MFASPPAASAARRGPFERTAALAAALLLSGALLGLVVFSSLAATQPAPPPNDPVLFTARQIPAEPPPPPPPETPADQPERRAATPDEAAPASRPRTMAPAPALPVIPPPAIALAPIELPAVPITGPGLALRSGADSRGDLPRGPRGAGGAGGDGTAGNGKGGAGNGRGDGNRLIASWAPDMDFSQNYRVYPREARLAGIEGEVLLKCFALRRDRVRDCTLVAETPVGHGFGKAALRTEKGLRIRVHNQAGRRVYNEWVVVRTIFDMPDMPVRAAADEAAANGTEAAP